MKRQLSLLMILMIVLLTGGLGLSEAIEPQESPLGQIIITAQMNSDGDVTTSMNSNIREQKLEDIERDMKIDESYDEAKQSLMEINDTIKKVKEHLLAQRERRGSLGQINSETLTSSEIIQDLMTIEEKGRKIDLDFDETELGNILVTLGEMGGMNIVLDPILRNNKIDLHLQGVTLEESLLLLANMYDLGFKRVGESLYVTTRDKILEESVTSKVIRLRNISVDQAKLLVRDLVKSVNISDEINSIIVVGEPDKIARVEKILRKIDKPQPQIILEAKVIEINKDALKDIGVDWSDSINLSYQEAGRPVDFDNIQESLGSPIEIFSIARNPIQLNTIIKMLESQDKAKILSNPRVTTLNNKEAEIFVGDRIPYTITTVTGGVATTEVRFEEPGIRLTIMPSIIEEDFCVIKVEPEVSYIYSFRGPDDQYPWVKKRSATSFVRIQNGRPFVIGGLLNQEDKKNLYKVPILGDVPLLGNLFSYEKHKLSDTELIITVIPTIVQDI